MERWCCWRITAPSTIRVHLVFLSYTYYLYYNLVYSLVYSLFALSTGLVKILKKYDKRTGALIRLPFIQRVLQQPFFTTDLLYKLVKECEAMYHLFPNVERIRLTDNAADREVGEPTTGITETEALLEGPEVLAEIEYMESLYMKSTVSALRVLKEIRKGSSTVSVFSLPPLQISGVEETWKKVPVLEQVAK